MVVSGRNGNESPRSRHGTYEAPREAKLAEIKMRNAAGPETSKAAQESEAPIPVTNAGDVRDVASETASNGRHSRKFQYSFMSQPHSPTESNIIRAHMSAGPTNSKLLWRAEKATTVLRGRSQEAGERVQRGPRAVISKTKESRRFTRAP